MDYLQYALNRLKTVLKGVPFKLAESPQPPELHESPDLPNQSELCKTSENLEEPEQAPRRLLLVRHAKSAWGTGAKRDYDRPLAARGKYDAPRMGHWLQNQGLFPDYVVSSPAKRTKQTTEMVCAKLGFDKAEVIWEPKLYNASLVELLEVLAACPLSAKQVMLVGHHTGLEPLLKFLYGPNLEIPGDVKLFPTAAVAQMEIPADWDRLYSGVARGFHITRPRSLPYEPQLGNRRSRKERRKANRKAEKSKAA